MTDISELRQIVEEAKELISQLDKRIDTLTYLVAMATNQSVDSIKSTIAKEVRANEELHTIICSIQENINEHQNLHIFQFNEKFFMGYTFGPRYYMDKVIEVFNTMKEYNANLIPGYAGPLDDFGSDIVSIEVNERK